MKHTIKFGLLIAAGLAASPTAAAEIGHLEMPVVMADIAMIEACADVAEPTQLVDCWTSIKDAIEECKQDDNRRL